MGKPLPTVNERGRLWYGWVILGVVFLVMAVMIGLRNTLGFFFKAIAGEFGWTRAQTAGAYSVGMLVQSLSSPIVGAVGERWTVRWLVAFGILVGGAALLIGFAIDRLALFYLMYALLNLGFAASTFVPQVQLISQWFVKRRGLAMGISNAGQGFAAVLTLAVPLLISLFGWRGSYLVLGFFTLLFLFPLAAVLLRDNPCDRNTVADAPFLSVPEREALASQPSEALSCAATFSPAAPPPFGSRFFTLPFFLIAVIYGAIAFVMTGTTVHLVPHATDQGFTPGASAWVFLVWGIFAIGGNLVSGMSDLLGRARTYGLGAVLGIAASLLLANYMAGMPALLFYAGSALSGLGLGLTRPTASALLADHFSGPGFGKLNGSAVMVFALFGALGAFATGHLFDVTGSYWTAFLAMGAAHAVGAASVLLLSRIHKAGGRQPRP